MYIYPPPKSIVKDNVKEAMDIPSKIFLTIKSKPCSHTLIGLLRLSKFYILNLYQENFPRVAFNALFEVLTIKNFAPVICVAFPVQLLAKQLTL